MKKNLTENIDKIRKIMGLDSELLTERSKLDILIDKKGLSREYAEILDRLCGSLSVWMFGKIEEYMNNIYLEAGEKEMTNEQIVTQINRTGFISQQRQNIQSIMDWVRVGLNGNIKPYKDTTYNVLLRLSKDWHDSLNISGGDINYVEPHTHEIVIDLRENGEGYYWVNLNTNDSRQECERMGHCGRSTYGNLYSLRSNKKIGDGKYTMNKSHLTASIGTDGTLYQLKGPKNSKPKSEYHELILPLFYLKDENDDYLITKLGTEYASERDFKITDLPDDVIKNLYENRPELFTSRSLKRKLIDMGLITLPNIDYNITVEIDPDDLDRYVTGDWVVRRYTRKTPDGGERKVSVTMFEVILAGETWDLYESWDESWDSALKYCSTEETDNMIREYLKKRAIKQEGEGFDEDEYNELSVSEIVVNYDDDYEVQRLINSVVNDLESVDYHNYLYDTLKDALSEYGTVKKMDNEKVIFTVDLKNYLNDITDDEFDDYMERCDYDLNCVFYEMVGNEIDKPVFQTDDRWTPDYNCSDLVSGIKERFDELP